MNFFSYHDKPYRSPNCRGKAHRRTRLNALAAVVRHYVDFGDALHAYECLHCGDWHVGHSLGPNLGPSVCRAIEAALAGPPPASPFLVRLRARTLASAARLCRGPRRDPEELIAAVVDELPTPGFIGRLTADQCEDVLQACEEAEGMVAA